MFNEWLSITGGVLAVVGVFAVAAAYFASNRAQTIIQLQKDELDARKETQTRLEEEKAELVARATKAEEHNRTLQELVTQRPEIETLAKDMMRQHVEVVDKLTKIAELLTTAGGGESVVRRSGSKN